MSTTIALDTIPDNVSIHDVSAEDFLGTLTSNQRIEFLAKIAAPWVGAGEDGSTALPTSYGILFERRVAQAAKADGVEAALAMSTVLALAERLATEDGLLADVA